MNSRTFYLGGAPFSGKSTVARIISRELGLDVIGTDDIGAALTASTTRESAPALHYMDGIDYREYYIERSLDQLTSDIDAQHRALWPALETLLINRSTWGHPAIMEGWALRPEYVVKLPENISGAFLLAEDSLLEKRVREADFSRGASDPEQMIRKYLQRSIWFNKNLRYNISRFKLKSIIVRDGMNSEDIAESFMQLNKS